jgi:hypothetical protein
LSTGISSTRSAPCNAAAGKTRDRAGIPQQD